MSNVIAIASLVSEIYLVTGKTDTQSGLSKTCSVAHNLENCAQLVSLARPGKEEETIRDGP